MLLAHATLGAGLCGGGGAGATGRAGRGLEEAAADLGAGPFTVFRTVTLPLIAPALAAGWLLAFTLSLDDVVVASFVSGPAGTTLPMLVFSRSGWADAGDQRAGRRVCWRGWRRRGVVGLRGRVLTGGGPGRTRRVEASASGALGSAPVAPAQAAMQLTAERLDRIQPSLTIAIDDQGAAHERGGEERDLPVAGRAGLRHAAQHQGRGDPGDRGGRDEVHGRRGHAGAAPGGGGRSSSATAASTTSRRRSSSPPAASR